MSVVLFQKVDAIVHSLVDNLAFDASCELISPPIHGSLLRYRLSLAQRYGGMALERLKKDAEATIPEVIVAFIEDQCLYLKIGFDWFQSTRLDAGKSSPLWSMSSAVPFASDQRPQWLCLTGAVRSLPDPIDLPWQSYLLRPNSPQMQQFAYLLHASLRLNSSDLSTAISLIEMHSEQLSAWVKNGQYFQLSKFIKAT